MNVSSLPQRLIFLLPTAISLLILTTHSPLAIAAQCVSKSEIDQPDRFVTQLYRDVLGRDPDVDGFNTQLAALNAQNSNECSKLTGDALFTCRWNNNADLAFNFLTGPEFRASHPKLDLSRNDVFLTAIYTQFLRFSPDSTGLANHLKAFSGVKPKTKRQVLYDFLTGDGFRNRFACCTTTASIDEAGYFIESLYNDVLGRQPEAGAVAEKTTLLNNAVASTCRGLAGANLTTCRWKVRSTYAVGFFNSDEYRAKNSSEDTDEEFVKSVYKRIFRVPGDDAGIRDWTNRLRERTETRGSLLNRFMTSPFYRPRFSWRTNPWYASCRRPASADEFQNYPAGGFNLKAGDSKTVRDVTMRLTLGGDFQVVNSGGRVLWHTGTSAACSPATCRVSFLGDGNLIVIGPGPSNFLWSSGTSNAGAALSFSSKESHLTIRNNIYNVTWKSGGTPSQALMASAIPSRLPATQSSRAQSFLNTMGIGTHFSTTDSDVERLVEQLNYVGIKSIRAKSDAERLPFFTELIKNKISFNLVYFNAALATVISSFERITSLSPKSVVSLEGPNEINNFPVSCDGKTYTKGVPNDGGPVSKCLMTKMYNAIKNSPILKHIPVIHLSGGNSARNALAYGLLSLNGQADFGNIHPYPKPTQQPRGTMNGAIASSYINGSGPKTYITETGYSTRADHGGVSLKAQAPLTLNIFFDAFQAGIPKTYLYTMTDDHEGFGLYDLTRKPKPVAVALHNLTTILKDAGATASTFTPGALNHKLTGMPITAQSLLLQKSNGLFYLVIWNEVPIWNGRDLTVGPKSVELNLGSEVTKIRVFRPVEGLSAVAEVTRRSTIGVGIAGDPVVIEVTK